MELNFEEKAVLLGLAEVKAPFKNLSEEERIRIIHICYRKLLEIELAEEDQSIETNLKCIGVVDSFYALQEVIFSIKPDGECFLYRKSEIILKHDLKDVLVALPASDRPSRIIIGSRTQNFGRTLLVLQLQSKEAVKSLVEKLSTHTQRVSSAPKSIGVFRRGADSWGKVVGKKVNDLLSSFGSDKPCDQISELNITSASETPETSVADEDDDDINCDSEQDECDSVEVKSVIVNSLYEPRPSFDKNLLSPLEAEIQYLIQSEIGFVDSLRRLLNCKTTLEEISSIAKRKQFDIMFKFVEELYIFHSDILENVKLCETNVNFICKLFQEHSENFRQHIYYISNISAADKIYNAYQEAFRQSNLVIGEDLRKPRMRLNHYILTLDSMKKSCEESDIQLLQDVISMFKEYLKEADTRLVTDYVVPCPINLMDYGYLVMNGELSLRKGEGLSKKHYHVLLLEKMLVLTKGNQNSSEYVVSYRLEDTDLVHDLRGVMIQLKIKTKRQKPMLVIFKAKSVKLQQKWIEKLKSQINLVIQNNPESQFQEQMFIEPLPKINQHHKKMKGTGNQRADEYSIMPPLTMKMAFKRDYQALRAKYSAENLLLCMRDIQETEKLLIKNMEHLLSQNVENNVTKLNDIKQMYEFHLRYFYPAVTFDKIRFDTHIVNSIATHKTNFMKYSERMLYHAAVRKVENIESHFDIIFQLFVDNFFKYRIYLCNISMNFDKTFQTTSDGIQILFEEIRKNLGHFLKYKYIENIPPSFSDNVIMEGLLLVKESLDDIENQMYIVITRLKTYLLFFTEQSFNIFETFDNENGKFGQPNGIKSFQIKFTKLEQQKRKFIFTTSDMELKNKWIKSFRLVLPKETKIRRRAKSEERTPRNKIFHSVSIDKLSLSGIKNKINQNYMESHF